MSNSFLKCRPSGDYHKYAPYTIEEVDDLPNAGRVWATLMEVRREAQEACNRARELGYQEGRRSVTDD